MRREREGGKWGDMIDSLPPFLHLGMGAVDGLIQSIWLMVIQGSCPYLLRQ